MLKYYFSGQFLIQCQRNTSFIFVFLKKTREIREKTENTSCICEGVRVSVSPCPPPPGLAGREPTMQTMSLPMPPFVPKICQNRLQTKHPDRKSRCQSRQICSISMFCLSPRFFCHWENWFPNMNLEPLKISACAFRKYLVCMVQDVIQWRNSRMSQ